MAPLEWIANFFDISLDRANQFYAWGWRLSAFGALITVTGIALLWWGTRIRDHEFETQIANTLERAGKLEVSAEQLREGNLELQRDIERERAERLKIAEKMKWRSISTEQRNTLIAALKDVPKGPVTVMHVLTEEPWQYAKQIAEVLRASGFLSVEEKAGPVSLSLPGEWILVMEILKAPPHAVPIQDAFRKIDVDLDGQPDPVHVPDDKTVVLLIGVKKP